MTLQYPVESVVDCSDVRDICIHPLDGHEYEGSNTGKKGVEWIIKGGTDKERISVSSCCYRLRGASRSKLFTNTTI